MTCDDLGWANRYDTIVLEGCDGVGKSHLALRIAVRTGATVVHCTVTPPGIDLVCSYLAILAQPGKLVLDRSFLSEAVYGPIHRSSSRLDERDIVRLVTRVVGRNGILVHMTATTATIRRRLQERGDDDVASGNDIDRIRTTYEELIATLSHLVPTMRLDTTSMW